MILGGGGGGGGVGGVREKKAKREKTTQFKQKFDFVNPNMDVFLIKIALFLSLSSPLPTLHPLPSMWYHLRMAPHSMLGS